jgi:acyl carrier protein
MTSFRDIHARVASVLATALGVDEDDVIPSATLQGDLGAESIDFLDIVFRLEREFGIKIPRGELFPDSILGEQGDLVREGRVTDRGMVELRSRMPYADLADFERDRRLSAVADLFTRISMAGNPLTFRGRLAPLSRKISGFPAVSCEGIPRRDRLPNLILPVEHPTLCP